MGFNVGDVVRLKSGGPLMTVAYLGEDGEVYCVWFNQHEEKRGDFPSQALKKEDETPPSSTLAELGAKLA